MWQLLVLASALLFGIGSSHSAFCQIFSGENGGITRSKRAPNPQINRLANKKQQAIEQAIEKGNKARDENNFGKALGHYQQALELNPREARAYYGLGNVYADVFCNASAIEAYHKAIKLKKNYLKALIGLADTYAVEERHDHAQEQYQKALALAPKNAEANLGLGVIHARKGRYQEAITQINLVINAQAIEDRATAHVVLGDVYSIELVNNHQKAIEQYQKAISLKPDLAIAYFALGNEQMNYAASRIDYSSPRPQEKLHTSMKQATDNIKRAIEYNLSHPGVHIFLGMALARQSLYQNAESEINIYFNKIKELESQLPSLALKCTSGFNMFKAIGYAGLGYVYFFEGTFEADEKQRAEFFSKAINQFNQAIKLKQDFVGAHLALALVYTLQGESEKAIEQYKKVILFAPINSYKAVGYEGIGFIYSKIDREALAVDYLQEAINLNPKRPSPYRWLAEIYVNQDKLKETIDLLKKSAQLEPETSATLYFDLGATYIGRCVKTANEEDFNEGIRLLKKAIEIKPNYADAYLAIGLAYLTRSKGDEALENAKKAAGYNPKDPQIYYLMAMV
jgi:superkiller protein 3